MIIQEQQLIAVLEDLKKTYAVAALSNPNSVEPAYEFGKHAGVMEGIERSKQRLLGLLHDGDDKKDERKRTISGSPYQA